MISFANRDCGCGCGLWFVVAVCGLWLVVCGRGCGYGRSCGRECVSDFWTLVFGDKCHVVNFKLVICYMVMYNREQERSYVKC